MLKEVERLIRKCLEFDRELRFSSADELVQVINQILSGQRFLADKVFVWKKLYFLIKSNRLQLFLSGLVIVILMVIFWIKANYIRFLDQRDILLAELEEQIKRVEDSLWYTYSLPLHDIRADLEKVNKSLEELKERAKRSKKHSGLIYYALGRCYTALGDYKLAQFYFEQAWNNYNYRTPNVAFYLALCLTIRFTKERFVAGGIYEQEISQDKIIKLEKEYLWPAQNFIRLGKNSKLEMLEFVEAIHYFLKKDYLQAISMIRKINSKFPWFYDGWRLRASVFQEMGLENCQQGDWQKAQDNFDRTAEILLNLLQKSESAPAVFRDLCELEINRSKLKILQSGGFPKENIERAIYYAQKALLANPSDQETLTLLAYIYLFFADNLLLRGVNPEERAEKSLEYVEKALKINPQNLDALRQKMRIFILLGAYDQSIGRDPTANLKKAITIGQKILQIEPEDLSAFNGLSLSFWNIANYKENIGFDPLPELEIGEVFIKQGISLNPQLAILYHNAGNIFLSKAYYQFTKKMVNALASVREAIEFFMQAMAINPRNSNTYNNLGEAFLLEARVINNENSALRSVTIAFCFLDEALKLNPDFVWTYCTLIDAQLIAARIKEKLKRDCQLHYQLAYSILNQKRWQNKLPYPLLLKKSELFIEEAQNNFKRGILSKQRLFDRIKEVNHDLKLFPKEAELFVCRGILFFCLARLYGDSKNFINKARRDLQLALALKSSLRFKYPFLKTLEFENFEHNFLVN